MYEDYYTPVPDIQAVLSRIQFDETAFPPDLAHLEKLIYAFQTHIPFEDLDSSWLNQPLRLDIPSLYEKLIARKRGGFCFELNGFFERLLKDLGYECYSVFCRIIRGRDFVPPCTHRGIIVILNGNFYYCDVGFGGPQPAGPVLVGNSSAAQYAGDLFRTEPADPDWWTLSYMNKSGWWENILQFTLQPQNPAEFIPVCFYCSTNPDSLFVKTRLVNLRTESGCKSVTDNTFTEHCGGEVHSAVISSELEFRRILQKEFDITAGGRHNA